MFKTFTPNTGVQYQSSGCTMKSRDASPQAEPAFAPHRRQLVYKLNMTKEDINKFSFGGFIIGYKGAKIQSFLSPINQEIRTPSGEQFVRLRGLGPFYHMKDKKNGQDHWKRQGDARFEITFAVYDARSKAKIVKYARQFEKLLDEAFMYFAWIQHKERNNSLAPDQTRVNLDLQQEFMDNKEDIEGLFRSGEIKPIRKQYTIEEYDLRPSIEQTPYMQKNGIVSDPKFTLPREPKEESWRSNIESSVYKKLNTNKINASTFESNSSGYSSPDESSMNISQHQSSRTNMKNCNINRSQMKPKRSYVTY